MQHKQQQSKSRCCFCNFWDHGIWHFQFLVVREDQFFFCAGDGIRGMLITVLPLVAICHKLVATGAGRAGHDTWSGH